LNQQHAHNHYPDFLWRNEEKISLNNVVTPVGDSGAGYATKAVQFADELFAQEVLRFVAESKEEPFFLYWAPVIPHGNNERTRALKDGANVPDYAPYSDRDWSTPTRGHAAMVTLLDTYVGRLLDALKEQGIAEKTLVIFTSDNGPHKESGHDAELFKPYGTLRGYKRDLTDGGIRVPFIAWWPGKISPGTESGHVGFGGDLMATASELVGTKAPEDTQSISFLPALLNRSDEQKKHEFLYWEFHERGFSQAALYQGRWKGIRSGADAPIVLYDLQLDLKESTNVAAENPEIVSKIEEFLKTARSESADWPVLRKQALNER
ncbi:MAG: N-acetylgalactosamine-6-sulfatase, partial [Verrucomicrobiaceae bacterium]